MYNGNTTFFLNYVNQALIGLVVIYNLKLSALFIGDGNVRSDACASHTGVSRSQHSQASAGQPAALLAMHMSVVSCDINDLDRHVYDFQFRAFI